MGRGGGGPRKGLGGGERCILISKEKKWDNIRRSQETIVEVNHEVTYMNKYEFTFKVFPSIKNVKHVKTRVKNLFTYRLGKSIR